MKVAVVARDERVWSDEVDELASALERARDANRLGELVAVAHRVVHAGMTVRETSVIDERVLDAIGAATPFAPTHNRAALAGIETARRALPDVPHVAVLDTAFHRTIPDPSAAYGGPRVWFDSGLRRYGFHGISHQWATRRAAHLLGAPVEDLDLVTCHLGGGCSITAVHRGHSADTTMGLTPLDGVVMEARSGAVDPGLLLHLLRNGTSLDELDDTIQHRSGLLGLSGVSEDLREVMAARDGGDERARFAIDVFVQRVAAGVGSMLASVEQPSALVFTGGIGEHSAEVRARVAARFAWLGVAVDAEVNERARGDQDVSAGDAAVRTLVVEAREEIEMAHEARRVVRSTST